MENKDNRLFVDGQDQSPLLPVFKGGRVIIFPGQLVAGSGQASSVTMSGNTDRRRGGFKSALRRYVFRYENGTFVYLATRKGQRNGGFNSKLSQTRGYMTITASGALPAPISEFLNFSFSGKNISNESIYTINDNSRIRYDSANTRWVWETRPANTPPTPPSGPYYVTAFTASTSNTLINSGTENEVSWTYVSYPFTTQTPQVPANVSIELLEYYKNNDVASLNKWPIKNVDADYKNGYIDGTTYKWQTKDGQEGIIPERRIDCLTDELLFRCFQGVPLKPYEIVFVEIMWNFLSNKHSKNQITNLFTGSNAFHGYNVNQVEWWSPAPFVTRSQKGRIYRIGKLEADTGIGGYDTVTFAQRTRLVTTKYTKGGFTALE
jgi:hypothetical protein